MADMVKLSISVTERQAAAIRAESRRRDVSEGEVVRHIFDFWIDTAAGKSALFPAPVLVRANGGA